MSRPSEMLDVQCKACNAVVRLLQLLPRLGRTSGEGPFVLGLQGVLAMDPDVALVMIDARPEIPSALLLLLRSSSPFAEADALFAIGWFLSVPVRRVDVLSRMLPDASCLVGSDCDRMHAR